jgi:glycosyltransferase involved in cell wall biosynthesis
VSSISIIIPARDEAPRLERTVSEVLVALRQHFERHELIIVDDASTDATAEIADRLAADLPEVRAIHLSRVHGLGGAFKKGLRVARMEYVTVVHGDGGTAAVELEKIWGLRHQAEVVVPYGLNDHERPAVRRLLSHGFRFLVNHSFGVRLRCHGHFVLYRRTLIQSIKLRTNGHAFQAEALVKLLRMGHSFVEVGVRDEFDAQGPTRTYNVANVFRVARFFVSTFYDVYIAPDRSVVSREVAGDW